MRYKYPFTAVVGQESLKKAILINLINNRVSGILVDGEKGTAKSTLIRSIDDISDKKIINLPLNISEDMLVGSIDIEKTIKTGSASFENGLLAKADKNILYIDEVNLLEDNIVDLLLDVSESKINKIEREGISKVEDSDFILIGSMNKEMGELRAEFLDRFPLYIYIEGCKEPRHRIEIIRRILDFENDPKTFTQKYENKQKQLKEYIVLARDFLEKVEVSKENLERIVKICLDYGVCGHRADIMLEQTAKAIAALEFSNVITNLHIDEAASLVIPHRATKQPDEEDKEKSEEDENIQDENNDSDENDENNENQNSHENHEKSKNENQDRDNESDENSKNNDKEDMQKENDSQSKGSKKTKIFDIGKSFKIKIIEHKKDRVYRVGKGKRSKTKAKNKLGQYLYSTQNFDGNDIAFDATIRAAAPYQNNREKNGLALALKRTDLRGKVRQKKISNLIVLVVDSSGSVGVNKRMIAVKAAILSLLKDSYVKRDKVSLILFRGEESEVILPPTTSVERGYKLLTNIKTGGKSPLNSGLYKAFEVIKRELRRDESIMPMMIVISDGKGNVSIDKNIKVKDELIQISNFIADDKRIKTLVIDVEKKGMMSFDRAKLLAKEMNSEYIALENLKSEDIISSIEGKRNIDE